MTAAIDYDAARGTPSHSLEGIYRTNVRAITVYFARRCVDPQTVADLTSETFLRAVRSYSTFDPERGAARPWLFGIARHVYAGHQATLSSGRDIVERVAGQIVLGEDEIEELAARIDDQREGRQLLRECAALPEIDRAAVELVDLAGLSTKQAAVALEVSAGALRVRLFRARARLRKGARRHD
jgi:RNA polymerase sigma factor (sigma-70 family)